MNEFILPGWGETVLKLGVAFALSALIGLEREARHRPAGLRTHVLVCTASCLLMMISISLGGRNFDPARLAAQVVTGIGFIGAGTIMRHGDIVRGLTTAASIWAVASLGLVVGMGWYVGALMGTALMAGTLLGLNWLEGRIVPPQTEGNVRAEISDEPQRLAGLLADIEAAGGKVEAVQMEHAASGRRSVSLQVGCEHEGGAVATAELLLAVDGVTSVECH